MRIGMQLLGLLALMFAPAAINASDTLVEFDSADFAVASERPSGEVSIYKRVSLAGKETQIRLTFTSMAAGRAIPGDRRFIDLGLVDKVLMSGIDGELNTIEVRSLRHLRELTERATQSICGPTVARGFQYVDGIPVAIDVQRSNLAPLTETAHSASTSGTGEPSNPGNLAMSCIYSSEDNVDGDCDTYAIGGCGGPNCRDYEQKTCFPAEGLPYTEYYKYIHGRCKAKVVNWGPDTCVCNSAGGLSEKHCWNPQTQTHDPC